MSLYQNKNTGQVVEFISYHDKDYAMVRNAGGTVSYAALADLAAYEPGKGRTGEEIVRPRLPEEPADDDVVPTRVIPEDARLNINLASAEQIADRVKGIGYVTAKKIVELRMSLPGEKFKTLQQLTKIGRVDWDHIFNDDVIYVA